MGWYEYGIGVLCNVSNYMTSVERIVEYTQLPTEVSDMTRSTVREKQGKEFDMNMTAHLTITKSFSAL